MLFKENFWPIDFPLRSEPYNANVLDCLSLNKKETLRTSSERPIKSPGQKKIFKFLIYSLILSNNFINHVSKFQFFYGLIKKVQKKGQKRDKIVRFVALNEKFAIFPVPAFYYSKRKLNKKISRIMSL